MDFKQLKVYVKVYELQSFSKAADEMFLSQPSVSAYISALEKELQTQLIYRSTKEFMPTETGKVLYERAKEILALCDKTIFSVKNSADCASGNINILASSVPAQYILPEMLGAFHKLYPDVSFSLEQADTADVVKGISSHKGDIGFVGARIENSKCVYEDFMSERLVMIAPNEERFQKVSVTDIPDLLYDEYFVMRETGSGTKLGYDEFLRGLGVMPDKIKVSARLNNTQGIIHAVASGLGISIVSELAVQHYLSPKKVIPIALDHPLPERRFYVVLKKNYPVTAMVDVFAKFIHSYPFRYKRLTGEAEKNQ